MLSIICSNLNANHKQMETDVLTSVTHVSVLVMGSELSIDCIQCVGKITPYKKSKTLVASVKSFCFVD